MNHVGRGAVAMMVSIRLPKLNDHAGRASPVFTHSLVTVNRTLSPAFLGETAAAFRRHVRQRGAEWYAQYYGTGLTGANASIESYIRESSGFEGAPRHRGPVRALAKQKKGGTSRTASRFFISYEANIQHSALLDLAARMVGLLFYTDVPWTWVTIGHAVGLSSTTEPVSESVEFHFIPRSAGIPDSRGNVHLRFESLRNIEEQLAKDLQLELLPNQSIAGSSRGAISSWDASAPENSPGRQVQVPAEIEQPQAESAPLPGIPPPEPTKQRRLLGIGASSSSALLLLVLGLHYIPWSPTAPTKPPVPPSAPTSPPASAKREPHAPSPGPNDVTYPPCPQTSHRPEEIESVLANYDGWTDLTAWRNKESNYSLTPSEKSCIEMLRREVYTVTLELCRHEGPSANAKTKTLATRIRAVEGYLKQHCGFDTKCIPAPNCPSEGQGGKKNPNRSQ